MGPAHGSTDADEGSERNAYYNSSHADANEDADDSTHDADALGYGYACAYAHASRNSCRNVGHTEVDPDDRTEQDADACRDVHPYGHRSGDQDADESADTQGNNHAGSDADEDADAHADTVANAYAHPRTADGHRYTRAADGNSYTRSSNAHGGSSNEYAYRDAHADVDEYAYCDSGQHAPSDVHAGYLPHDHTRSDKDTYVNANTSITSESGATSRHIDRAGVVSLLATPALFFGERDRRRI